MAEAEDVITDVARHATIFARDLWRRHRPPVPKDRPDPPRLVDFARRIDLLVNGVFGVSYPIRIAQPPAPPALLTRLFRRAELPRLQQAVPATDGKSIWLPASCGDVHPGAALERYRVVALQQAMRAHRGSAAGLARINDQRLQDAYLLLEAHAADHALARLLPGLAPALERLRGHALAQRPPPAAFPPHRRPLEAIVRRLLKVNAAQPSADLPASDSPAGSLDAARGLLQRLQPPGAARSSSAAESLLLRDWWTGDLFAPDVVDPSAVRAEMPPPGDEASLSKAARLARSPRARRAAPDEDDERQGAFMIQTAQPHEHAEDAAGMQRPTDQDQDSAAEDFAESVADLPEVRLVSTPGRVREVLISDDAPDGHPGRPAAAAPAGRQDEELAYPEWDYRIASYRPDGVLVKLRVSAPGSQQWVDTTLQRHRALRERIRRRFEMLRAEPVRLRRQLDGEEIDLDAWVEAHADYHAGLPMAQALYQSRRRARSSLAIMLLIDISGSTDAWIGAGRRIIDVEREALLLVCEALQSLAEPYSVLAFSGEGPRNVSLRPVKRFDEPYSNLVARRIAALEPEHYTRAGAAIRHATSLLMNQTAAHRLLLLLSDGKPNDVDVYEGRYGIEDTRQAVCEARLQGVMPFCLTVDRQAANYLPAIFGRNQYGMLPRPELLPAVLLEWIKRLVSS
jgi:nitric oxide reductase NorD protein